jgi:hypothetical protein
VFQVPVTHVRAACAALRQINMVFDQYGRASSGQAGVSYSGRCPTGRSHPRRRKAAAPSRRQRHMVGTSADRVWVLDASVETSSRVLQDINSRSALVKITPVNVMWTECNSRTCRANRCASSRLRQSTMLLALNLVSVDAGPIWQCLPFAKCAHWSAFCCTFVAGPSPLISGHARPSGHRDGAADVGWPLSGPPVQRHDGGDCALHAGRRVHMPADAFDEPHV